MPPKSDKRYDAAVKAVLDGHDLKRAWEECGKPGTNEDSALRNIRKRVAAEQAKAAAAAPPPPKRQLPWRRRSSSPLRSCRRRTATWLLLTRHARREPQSYFNGFGTMDCPCGRGALWLGLRLRLA